MNGYELSKNWFDWCFENPEKISPAHTAIYFFAIEHCNRLGGKEKFGFPSQMTMDAIGIKKPHTYIKYFNDIVDWGFFQLIQKSCNQYSSNIISLNYAKPKNGRPLGKAMAKHTAEHGHSTRQGTGSIIKPINLITLEPNNNPLPLEGDESVKPIWKNDFDIYLKELRTEFKTLLSDKAWILQQEGFNPGIDVRKSIEKSCVNYWATVGGWKKKKGSKITDIDWKATFANAISLPQNRVYQDKNTEPVKQTTTEPAI